MKMVEWMARAICQEDGDPSLSWDYYVPHALAALKAMREANNQMIVAGGESAQSHCDLTMIAATSIYTAMIDAAIKEAEE